MITEFKLYEKSIEWEQSDIINAVEKNDIDAIKMYYDQGINLNFVYEDYDSNYNLLYTAIMNDDNSNLEMFKLLIEYRVDVNFISKSDDERQYSLLSVSAYWNKIDIFEYILSLNIVNDVINIHESEENKSIVDVLFDKYFGEPSFELIKYLDKLKDIEIDHIDERLLVSYSSNRKNIDINVLYFLIDKDLGWEFTYYKENKTFIDYCSPEIKEKLKKKYPEQYEIYIRKKARKKFKI